MIAEKKDSAKYEAILPNLPKYGKQNFDSDNS